MSNELKDSIIREKALSLEFEALEKESFEDKIISDFSADFVEESESQRIDNQFQSFLGVPFKDCAEADISVIAANSFIDYASGVILERSIPDLRDGLKHSQERILVAMKSLGISSTGSHKKCARIVGQTIGIYHPHGDTGAYDTLVTMSQGFKNNLPMIDGQGNFGSIDGDSAAAQRYTEARMTKYGALFFRDIGKDIIDYIPNYDGTEVEPSVLPIPVPNILINGVLQGSIAVGMSSSILPHNSNEVMDAFILLLNNRKNGIQTISEDLLLKMPAPDFPTGGIVYETDCMLNVFKYGRGTIRNRAKHSIESFGRGKKAIVITEIPFAKNKTILIEELVLLKKNEKFKVIMSGITNIIDESDSNIRIVLELKSTASEELIWNLICKETNFDTTHYYLNIVVDNRVLENGDTQFFPIECGLTHIFNRYLDFRISLLVRKWEYIKRNALLRLHVVEGLLIALENINEIIEVVKKSRKFETALSNLMERFNLSKIQATAVINMRIARLTGLEKTSLVNEKRDLKATVKESDTILNSENIQMDLLIEDAILLKKEIGVERKTVVGGVKKVGKITIEDLAPKENVLLQITNKGYIRKINSRGYSGTINEYVVKKDLELTESDYLLSVSEHSTHDNLFILTNLGNLFSIKVDSISDLNRGIYNKNLVDLSIGEEIFKIMFSENFGEEVYLTIGTSNGFIKRTKLSDLSGSARKTGISVISLKNTDIIYSEILNGSEDLFFVTKLAKSIRFNISEVRETGRGSKGVTGIKLKKEDSLISITSIINENTKISIFTELGNVKTLLSSDISSQSRAGVGVFIIQLNRKSGNVIHVLSLKNSVNKNIKISLDSSAIISINSEEFVINSKLLRGSKINAIGDNKIVEVI